MNIGELSAPAEQNEEPSYTRAQARADGAPIDVSTSSKDAGFEVPVADTAMVWTLLEPSERDELLGQAVEGRLRAVLGGTAFGLALGVALMSRPTEPAPTLGVVAPPPAATAFGAAAGDGTPSLA
ncbi:MAG: hypothetical protein OZ921_21845, partial [Sorangiineae bacterium]|nr:hypothetical protein [Sorangiineae bacterium]